jgi:hypothetical protein
MTAAEKMPNIVTRRTACGQEVLLDAEIAARLGDRSLSLGSHGYVQIWDGEVHLLHRWIMGVARGEGYARIVDHFNGDRLDNRRENLRIVSATESNLNRGVKGRCVYPTRHGKWVARVAHRGKNHYLGTFPTVERAEAAVSAFRARHGIEHLRFGSSPPRPDAV